MNTWIYEAPAAFANVVSGFSLTLVGLFLLVLNRCLNGFFPPQPLRWRLIYISLVVTGIPTGLYHGWGETPLLRTIDLSTNLVLAWLGLYCVVYDRPRPRWMAIGTWMFFGLSLVAIVGRLALSNDFLFFELQNWGGFFLSEILLIVQGLITMVIHLINLPKLPSPARPLCVLTIAIFLIGMGLATASNQQILWNLLPVHALWHFVGGLAYLSLWIFNFVRFSVSPRPTAPQ